MMGFLGAGNTTMVGMTVDLAVAVEEALKLEGKTPAKEAGRTKKRRNTIS